MKKSDLNTVAFADGTTERLLVYPYLGACRTGDPTAYVHRNGQLVWVRPVLPKPILSEEVAWNEAN